MWILKNILKAQGFYDGNSYIWVLKDCHVARVTLSHAKLWEKHSRKPPHTPFMSNYVMGMEAQSKVVDNPWRCWGGGVTQVDKWSDLELSQPKANLKPSIWILEPMEVCTKNRSPWVIYPTTTLVWRFIMGGPLWPAWQGTHIESN